MQQARTGSHSRETDAVGTHGNQRSAQATNTALISEIVGSECSTAQQIAADTEAFGDNLVSSEVTKGFQRRTWHLLANIRKVIATQSAAPTDCSFWCVPVLESPPPERGQTLA